jgi:CDP-diacylglycerol---glycerol-3-phosphate 3-phosphatidyltransferase
MDPIAAIRKPIRRNIEHLAIALNGVTRGRVTPDMITWVGFTMHFVIAYYIMTGGLVVAAILLVIFGLFDTLDGSLARLQKIDSPRGMFLDAATDRLKEVILYTAAAWYLLGISDAGVVLSVLACGIALSISYVKAKGEAAFAANTSLSHRDINQLFHDGLAAFEIRITLLALGLIIGNLPFALGLIVVLGGVTLVQRFVTVYRAL